jgi:hypothetical protein
MEQHPTDGTPSNLSPTTAHEWGDGGAAAFGQSAPAAALYPLPNKRHTATVHDVLHSLQANPPVREAPPPPVKPSQEHTWERRSCLNIQRHSRRPAASRRAPKSNAAELKCSRHMPEEAASPWTSSRAAAVTRSFSTTARRGFNGTRQGPACSASSRAPPEGPPICRPPSVSVSRSVSLRRTSIKGKVASLPAGVPAALDRVSPAPRDSPCDADSERTPEGLEGSPSKQVPIKASDMTISQQGTTNQPNDTGPDFRSQGRPRRNDVLKISVRKR